ncbi:hypothetical protein B0H11DRAFT_2244060 [Mycena galericulata]|nr:hypothetical protein B0H11DRAFT_2244060 [Mycena galericulata]
MKVGICLPITLLLTVLQSSRKSKKSAPVESSNARTALPKIVLLRNALSAPTTSSPESPRHSTNRRRDDCRPSPSRDSEKVHEKRPPLSCGSGVGPYTGPTGGIPTNPPVVTTEEYMYSTPPSEVISESDPGDSEMDAQKLWDMFMNPVANDE